MNKLKMWNAQASWEDAESQWDARAHAAEALRPVKKLTSLPNMPGMTPDTAKNLKWKSLKWMVAKDKNWMIFKNFFKHPLKYGRALITSMLKGKSYKRDDDFFLYGIDSTDHFLTLMDDPKSLLVVGFSYCHKPFECPSQRFTPDCIHDPENPICQQCFIGKTLHALPDERTIPLIIPTIHYIGEQIFDVVHKNPGKRVLFIITACEMTLEMFGDWGNMVEIQGIGVRLDGRICNTMKAFELSEEGIKPGLTVVLDRTQNRILQLVRKWREKSM